MLSSATVTVLPSANVDIFSTVQMFACGAFLSFSKRFTVLFLVSAFGFYLLWVMMDLRVIGVSSNREVADMAAP